MSDDWDAIDSTPAYSSGMNSGAGLRGMGRGQRLAEATSSQSDGFGSSDTFGGRPLRGGSATTNGGFGSAGNNRSFGNNDDNGFGSRGGFGSKDFGGGSRNGFDAGGDTDNGVRSGGGFGSRGGSSRGGDGKCFLCGEEGHMSRECPKSRNGSGRGGGGGGGRGCHKCGEEGHMARECPTGGGGGGGSRACHKCGEEGHMARECPTGGGGGGGSRACHKCGEEGHMARECPKSGGGGRGCFNCGEDGHMSRDCPNPKANGGGRGGRSGGGGERRGGFGGGFEDRNGGDEPRGGGFERRGGFGDDQPSSRPERNGFGDGGFGGESKEGFGGERSFGGERQGGDRKGCFKCGEDGHMSRDCPKGGSGGSRACFKCNQEGHMSRECPNAADGDKKGCFKCGEEGHMSRDCPKGGSGGSRACFKCNEEGHMSRDCPNAAVDDGRPKPVTYIPPPEPEDEEHIFSTMMKGINFDKYDQIKVLCTGTNAMHERDTLTSFETADLDDIFKENVKKSKYEKPTPVQKWAIPAIMKGHDIMGCAQTGSGKTAAFLLPILTLMRRQGVEGSAFSEYQSPQAIVVGPTRELVVQINHEARKFAYNTMIRSVVTYGGVSKNSQRDEIRKGAHIVVGSPGRLLDFIKEGSINLSKVRFLVLDEADRMLDMGFMTSIQELINNPRMPPKNERQTLMFSATFPDSIQELARQIMRDDYLFLTVGRIGGANTDIEQLVLPVDQYSKRDQLISILNETGNKRVLIFVEQKRQADFLASFLSQTEFPTTSIHGDREQREREEALRDFKVGKAKILVATSVCARGLDISGVDHVVNYDMPLTIEDYVHRIGRTGRCGNTGRATSFFDQSKDQEIARSLVKVLTDALQPIPDWLEALAESNVGTGFAATGGQFGAQDTRSRRGNFGGGGRGGGRRDDFEAPSNPSSFAPVSSNGSGFGGSTAAAGNDDDMWD